MAKHSISYIYAILFALSFLFVATSADAQTLLVDTGQPTTAATSLFAEGNQNCSPRPSCTQSFQFWAGQFTLAHAATITSVQTSLDIFSGGGITVKIYADGGGIPGTAIYAQTFAEAANFVDGWVPFVFSSPNPILAAGTYWLAFEPVANTATTGTGFSSNMDGGAPTPLAHYAVWNDASFLNQFGNGYRAFATGIFSLGMRVSGTNFPDLVFGTVGRATMAGDTFGIPFSEDNITGGIGQASIFEGAGDIPGGWALIRASLFPNSLSTGAWTGASICFSPLTNCTDGSGSARSVVFRTWTNPTSSNVTFSVNAILDGSISNFGGTPGSAIGRAYLFDPTLFSNTVNASANPAQFLVSSVPVTQDLTGLFPSGTVLTSTSQTLTGPTNTALVAPLKTNAITVGPGQSFTVMFDVTTVTPAGNAVDFFSTLAPAAALFTDQSNNPVTQLVAVGPAVPAPAAPGHLALAPSSMSSPIGTTATITATATDASSAPIPGAIVYFTIATGSPNATAPVPAITDVNGQATFTYTDAGGAGTDSIHANIGALQSTSVTQTWTTPGPLDHIAISPTNSTIAPSGSQPYTAQGFDVFNNSLGDVTAATTFTISPDGSCTGATCTATTTGSHTVTGSDNRKSAQATLLVSTAKPSSNSTVTSNHNPSILGQSVAFTATVTPVSPATGTPTGTVTFKDGTTTLASGVALSSGAATFSTSSLSLGTHTITAVYSGDANFTATGIGSSTDPALTQQVQFGVCLAYDPTRSVSSGATFPLKLYLCNASGSDMSSSGIIVHAISVFKTSNLVGSPEDSGNSNPGSDFRFDPTIGPSGGYIFNLSTSGLAAGTYGFTFTAGNDPTTHSVLPGFSVH